MIVAIDGPAGTGKSTVARRVADAAGLFYLNSGNFYRAVTWYVLANHRDLDDTDSIIRDARSLTLDIRDGNIVANDSPLTSELRSREVDLHVAKISSIPEIRDVVNRQLRELAARADVIAEGRDMATVVFPASDVKIYLDASLAARARRRHTELGGVMSLDEVQAEIAERDQIDTTKEVGRLKLHPQALYIDSSQLTLDQVCEMVLQAILSHNPQTGETQQT